MIKREILYKQTLGIEYANIFSIFTRKINKYNYGWNVN